MKVFNFQNKAICWVDLEFKEKNSILDWDLELGPLAFRANTLTNGAIQDMYRTTIELISWAIFSVLRTDILRVYYVL